MIDILAQAHGHAEPFTEQLVELLGNPAHWIFEWINDAVTYAVLLPFGRIYVKYRERQAVRKHDQQYHPDHVDPEDSK